jgi:hypothetical protein
MYASLDQYSFYFVDAVQGLRTETFINPSYNNVLDRFVNFIDDDQARSMLSTASSISQYSIHPIPFKA